MRLRHRRDATVVAAVLLLTLLGLPGVPLPVLRTPPARADTVATQAGLPPAADRLREALPRPGAVVAAGVTELSVQIPAARLVQAQLTLDDQPLTTATTRATDPAAGADTLVVRAVTDVSPGSHVAAVSVVFPDGSTRQRSWRFQAADVPVRRLAGADRIATAVAAARRAFPDGEAPAAVLARADDFADALAGAPLAAALGAPLLLSTSDGLPPATAAALRELLADDAVVHLLGGTAVLSAEVEADLRRAGYDVERHAGADRYATAVAIARRLRAGASPSRVVLVSGQDFPDALAAAVPAAIHGWPVLLTRRRDLPQPTAAFLRDVAHDVERVEVIGGRGAVGPTVVAELPGGLDARRTGGADRFATAALVAERFLPPDDTPGTGVLLASGAKPADALVGAVLGARRRVPLLLAADRLPAASERLVRARVGLPGSPAAVTVLGGPAAVPERVVEDLRRVLHDGVGPAVELSPAAGSVLAEPLSAAAPTRLTLRLPGVALDDRTQVSVLIDGREAPIRLQRASDTATVELLGIPAGVAPAEELPVSVVAGLHGPQGSAHTAADLRLRRAPAVPTPEGFLALPGQGAVAGSAGPLRTYSLEVESGMGVDLRAFAAAAEAALSAPRGWTAQGRQRLQRVEPGVAEVRVVLARPQTVDAYCGRAGMVTGGIYSCWTGRFAMLNLDRWQGGAAGFAGPLTDYRAYLVNHEVGHALGHDHAGCPAPGLPAPVMMQQTKGTGACLPNPWPAP